MATPLKKPDYLRLSCAVQTYAWGKVGLESEVARLKSSAEPDNFVVDEGQTYAEVLKSTVFCGRVPDVCLFVCLFSYGWGHM